MTLFCENPSKVTLKYLSVVPNEIRYTGKRFATGGTRLGDYPYTRPINPGALDSYSARALSLDTEITWDFEPDPLNSWYRYPVEVTHAGTKNDPSTVTYDAFFTGRYQDIDFWFNENGTVYWQVAELSPQKTTAWVKPGWTKVDSPREGTTNREILAISIGKGEIQGLFSYAWTMKIYFNGEYKVSKTVRSSENKPPENDVHIIEGKPGPEITKDFLFFFRPEKVELVKVPNEEYRWKLIKIISEEETEDLLFFEGIDPQLLCFVGETEGECPQNTCPVSCGDTICCYGSDGISVTSFLKEESVY